MVTLDQANDEDDMKVKAEGEDSKDEDLAFGV